MKHVLIALMLGLLALPAHAGPRGEQRDPFRDLPSVGQPLRFLGADGGAFQPRLLLIQGTEGAVRAVLPATSDHARSEDRIDLSGTPLVGVLFEETLDTATARQGRMVGTVHQAPGGVLLIETTGPLAGLTGGPVTLTTHLPRLGAVSYALPRLGFGPSGRAVTTGPRIGTAHLVGDRLVLASDAGGPAYPSVEQMVRDLLE